MSSSRKSELERMQAELTARLERYHAHQHRQDGALDPDFSEQAVERQNDEVVDGLEAESEQALQQVKHALIRLDKGVGDLCEQCGEPINPERLRVRPQSTLCIKCSDQ